MIHKLLVLLRRQQQFEFGINSLHTLHVLRSGETLLAETRVFEIHTIDGIDTNGILDSQFACQTHGLL